MSPAAWQRKVARRWRLLGIVSVVAYVVLQVTDFGYLKVIPSGVAIIAALRMADGFGWADGWDSRSEFEDTVEELED